MSDTLVKVTDGASVIQSFGYVITSGAEYVQAILPDKPFGQIKQKLPQRRHKVEADLCCNFEVRGFEFVLNDDGTILTWKFIDPQKVLETAHFLALLADGRVLTDDCKTCKVWKCKSLESNEFVSWYDYMFSSDSFERCNGILLYVKDSVIYGAEETNLAKSCVGSYWVEDKLAEYLNKYDRYKISFAKDSAELLERKLRYREELKDALIREIAKHNDCELECQETSQMVWLKNAAVTTEFKYAILKDRVVVSCVNFKNRRSGCMRACFELLKSFACKLNYDIIVIQSVQTYAMQQWCLANGFEPDDITFMIIDGSGHEVVAGDYDFTVKKSNTSASMRRLKTIKAF